MSVIDYTPDKTIAEFIKDYVPGELHYSFIIGPYGCLAPETLVLTEHGAIPIAHIDRTMRVLSWNETTCRFQLSWCAGSFRKGTDYLYRVTTPEGEFDAAGAHRLLCADGEYRLVESLRPGDELSAYSTSQHQTTEELCRKASPEDARHLRGTLADCQDGCAASGHQHGQQLQQEASIAPAFVPSLDGAPGYAVCSSQAATCREDGLLARIHTRIRRGLLGGRQEKRHCVGQSETRGEASASSSATVSCEHDEGSSPELLRSPQSFLSRLREMLQGWRLLLISRCEAFEMSSSCLRATKRPILNIVRREVKQDFWDTHVIGTNNYVTVDGAIHHNSGKTTGAIMKIAYMAGLQAPSPVDGIRRSKCVVVRNTFAQLRDTSVSSFNYWFKDGVAGKWYATKNEFLLKFADVECLVMFRALDTADDVSRVLSLEITFAFLEEFIEIPKEILEALSGRCGRYPPKIEGGATNFGVFGSSNPGEEDSFWYDFLVDKKPANVHYYHQPSGLAEDAENLGNLPAGYYKNLAEGKSDAWTQVYIHANWGYSVAGRPVVPTFNREIHVSKTPLTPNQHIPLVIGYDPGVQNSAMTFGQMDLYGRLLIFGELQMEGYGALRTCTDRLIPLLRSPRYSGLEVIIAPDPAANSRSQTNETTVVEVLRRPEFKKWWSVKVDDTNLLTPRLDAIEHFTTRLTERGPALVIDPSCKGLIRALQGGWRYTTTKRDGDKPAPDKNLSSHVADSMTYLARYHVKNEARVGRRGQQVVAQLPRFGNPYSQK